MFLNDGKNIITRPKLARWTDREVVAAVGQALGSHGDTACPLYSARSAQLSDGLVSSDNNQRPTIGWYRIEDGDGIDSHIDSHLDYNVSEIKNLKPA